MDDQLHHKKEDDELHEPGRIDEAALHLVVAAAGQRVADDDYGHHNDPDIAHLDEGNDIGRIEVGEDIFDDEQTVGHRGCAEEDEEQTDIGDGQHPRQSLDPPVVGEFFQPGLTGFMNGETDAVHATPKHKFPGCSMPQTAHEHGQEIVDIGADGAFAVAPQRNVDIVAKPRR